MAFNKANLDPLEESLRLLVQRAKLVLRAIRSIRATDQTLSDAGVDLDEAEDALVMADLKSKAVPVKEACDDAVAIFNATDPIED